MSEIALRRPREHYEKVSAALRGFKHTDQARARMLAAARDPARRAKVSAGLQGHPVSASTRAAVAAQNRRRFDSGWRTENLATKPEQTMAALLEWAGLEFEAQKRIGRYIVDFYLPRTGGVVEVDGVYWHPNGPDLERDAALRTHGVTWVHHVTDVDLRGRGWL